MKYRKKQEAMINKIVTKYFEKDNLIPKPMEDKDFIEYIIDYFWGKDRYVTLSINSKQANVIILLEIIGENKGVK